MSQTFQCPNCGAPLDYDGGSDPVIPCPYCKSTVIVPEELHTAHTGSSALTTSVGMGLDNLLQPEKIAHLREIGRLVRQGQKVEAVNLYREIFGAELKEAQEAIDRLAAGKAIAITHTSQQSSQEKPFPAQDAQAEAEIRQLLQNSGKIAAIKRYREVFNTGLLESKVAVEFLEKNGHLPNPSSPIWHLVVSDAPGASEKNQALAEVISLAQSGQLEAAIAQFQQAFNASPTEAHQAVQSFNTSTITPSSLDASSKRALKTAAGVAGGMSCLWVILIAGFFILTVFVPVFLALTSPGGPLEGLWARYNPVAFARVIASFGGEGSGPGLFDDPRLIAVNPAGDVFVADYSDGRVQKFDASGKFQFLWNTGDNSYLNGLGTDRSGNVYVLNRGQIWKYDGSNGKLLGQLASDSERRFDALATTLDGGLVVAADSEYILRFNSDGQVVFSLADAGVALSGKPESINDIAVDGLGNIYLIGDDTSTIYKYAPDGQLLARFGSRGDEPGQFHAPETIAVDGQGRIYISDFKGIQVFATDGRYLGKFNVQGFAHGLDFTDQGELWVVTNKPLATEYKIVK
jgi:ribosomal protein L7/L12/outer membrane protein assembly factor BamB/DNA-directed RNA polymerase subunit RPC12/RpoP